MPSAILGDRREAVDVNRARTLAAIVYLAVVGPCVFILQPGFVQGLVEHLGFSEQQAGYIASAEMLGLAATTVLLSAISHRISWRNFMALCVAVCVSGNLLSIGRTEFESVAALKWSVTE